MPQRNAATESSSCASRRSLVASDMRSHPDRARGASERTGSNPRRLDPRVLGDSFLGNFRVELGISRVEFAISDLRSDPSKIRSGGIGASPGL
jgi:hypothetical protein